MSTGVVYASLETEKNDVGPDGEDQLITVKSSSPIFCKVSFRRNHTGNEKSTRRLYSLRTSMCVTLVHAPSASEVLIGLAQAADLEGGYDQPQQRTGFTRSLACAAVVVIGAIACIVVAVFLLHNKSMDMDAGVEKRGAGLFIVCVSTSNFNNMRGYDATSKVTGHVSRLRAGSLLQVWGSGPAAQKEQQAQR